MDFSTVIGLIARDLDGYALYEDYNLTLRFF
jgi:hypothetical protein